MLLYDAFEKYIENAPHLKGTVHTVYLELRRGKINTIEELREIFYNNPQALLKIRGIGPKSFNLIKDILEKL